MKTRTHEKSWADIRGDIKRKFSRLSDETLDSLNESFEKLSEKVQQSYGIAKDKADREIDQLKKSLRSTTEDLLSDADKLAKGTSAKLHVAKKKVHDSESSKHH